MSTSEATSIGGPAEEQERRPLANPETAATAPVLKRSAPYVLRKTVREFLDDGCTDLAAALTYYAVLSVLPAALALLSLLGLVGSGGRAVDVVVRVLRPLVSDRTVATVEPTLRTLAASHAGGIAFVVGILGALWSASAWVNALSRAMNRIYEVEEGRPVWKLRPTMLLVTLAALVLCAVAVLALVVSGPVATALGNVLGLGGTLLTVWAVVKWPVLAVVVVGVVALLYWATPNVRQPRFRILSVGALVAIVVWVAASVGFAFYVAHFSSYNATYGSLGGVVVALLWLWLTNNALLFGGELDAELERARELAAGAPAEEGILLPVRDDRGIRKAERRRRKDADAGRRVRDSFGTGDPADRPFVRR